MLVTVGEWNTQSTRIEGLKNVFPSRALWAIVATLPLSLSGTVDAGAEVTKPMVIQENQQHMNLQPGPRSVPGRLIPVPDDLDAGSAALVAAPYSAFWNLNPPDDDSWRAIVKRAIETAAPMVAQQRAILGVSISPTTLGGVKAYILTPKTIPSAHQNQVVFHIHGGGYIFTPGEAGTGEAAVMAAYGGYKVISIDYRMPPDAPYPAAMEDVTAAWRALVKTMDARRIVTVRRRHLDGYDWKGSIRI